LKTTKPIEVLWTSLLWVAVYWQCLPAFYGGMRNAKQLNRRKSSTAWWQLSMAQKKKKKEKKKKKTKKKKKHILKKEIYCDVALCRNGAQKLIVDNTPLYQNVLASMIRPIA